MTPDELLAAVRNGRRGLGSLLGRYRDRLKWRAREAASPRLQVRSSPSDIVQDTMLHACRDFPQFQGTSENELWAWLKRILDRRVLGAVRRHVSSHKRDLRREVSIEQFRPASDRSSVNLGERLAAEQSTPSGHLVRLERRQLVRRMISGLPHDYRRVLFLRIVLELPFDEVAVRLNRNPAAARKLYERARRLMLARVEREELT